MPSTFTAGKNTINLGIFIKKLFPNCHLQKLLDYGQKKNFFFFLACWSFYGQLKTISNYRSGNIKLVVQFLQFIVCSLFVVAILQLYCGHIHLHLVLLVGCLFFCGKNCRQCFISMSLKILSWSPLSMANVSPWIYSSLNYSLARRSWQEAIESQGCQISFKFIPIEIIKIPEDLLILIWISNIFNKCM